MTQRPILENCPFCSSSELSITQYGMEALHENPEEGFHAVCCEECGALGAELAPKQRAIDAWNRRPPSAGELHWKNNHDSVVAKSRVLIERKDMPIERVKAFQYITSLEEKIKQLEGQLRERHST